MGLILQLSYRRTGLVPAEENTYVLANRYMRLGGPVTVYPNTRGRQSLKGHHFEIDDVEAGVEFIIGSYGIGRHPDISDKDVQGMGSEEKITGKIVKTL